MIEAKEPEVLIKANILAYENRYKEVAALYRDHGYENKAMELFTDLKMFDEAQVRSYELKSQDITQILVLSKKKLEISRR